MAISTYYSIGGFGTWNSIILRRLKDKMSPLLLSTFKTEFCLHDIIFAKKVPFLNNKNQTFSTKYKSSSRFKKIVLTLNYGQKNKPE